MYSDVNIFGFQKQKVVACLLFFQFPLNLISVADAVVYRLGQLRLDAGQPAPQGTHVFV